MIRPAKKLLSLILLLTLTFLLASCTGDEGPAGPTGPEGPAGADGAGAEITIVTVSFTGAEADLYASWNNYNVAVPEITQEVVDNGSVIVYLNNSPGASMDDGWIGLPYVVPDSGGAVSFMYMYEPGYLGFLFLTDAETWPFDDTDWYHFKVVILTEPLKSCVNVEDFDDVRMHYQDRLLEREL